MGQRTGLQEQLFYEFRLDDWVPADHLLRKIDAVLDRGSRKTRRWRKPDTNSESRSEKAFHAEPMVCTTLRWRRQSRANPSLKQAHVGGQLTRGARGYKNKLGNNPMRRPTEGNVRVAQERAMDV